MKKYQPIEVFKVRDIAFPLGMRFAGECVKLSNEAAKELIIDIKKTVGIKKEKEKMNKPIFENEEEAREFFNEMWRPFKCGPKQMVEEAKQKGYIKKSALEEAEETWKCITQEISIDFSGSYLRNLIHASTYIRLLKEEIVRLKENE